MVKVVEVVEFAEVAAVRATAAAVVPSDRLQSFEAVAAEMTVGLVAGSVMTKVGNSRSRKACLEDLGWRWRRQWDKIGRLVRKAVDVVAVAHQQGPGVTLDIVEEIHY